MFALVSMSQHDTVCTVRIMVKMCQNETVLSRMLVKIKPKREARETMKTWVTNL